MVKRDAKYITWIISFHTVNYCLQFYEANKYIEITSHVLINNAVWVENITEGSSLTLRVRNMS